MLDEFEPLALNDRKIWLGLVVAGGPMNAGHGGPNNIPSGGPGGLGTGASHQAHHPPGQNHYAPHLMTGAPNMTMEPPPHLAPEAQQNARAMAPVPPPYPGWSADDPG